MTTETRFPRFTVAGGLELVPPTVLILTDHPVAGAATLAVVMVAWFVRARMIVRDQRDLPYVSHLGDDDPAPVIRELRRRRPDVRDDRDLFHPEDDEGWVHLQPSDW